MDNNKGFSLLEILISITLLAIMMVFVIDLTNDGLDTKDSVLSEDRELLQLEMAVNRIVNDLSNRFNPLFFAAKNIKKTTKPEDEGSEYYDSQIDFIKSERFPQVTVNGLMVPVFEAEDKDTIIFLSMVNRRKVRDIKQSNYVWIKYDLRSSTITDDDKKRTDGDFEIIRYFDANNLYKPTFDWDSVKPQLLLRNVKTLEFSYWHKNRRKWVDTPRELPQKDKVIRGVHLKLVYIDTNNEPIEINRVIRVNWPVFDTVKDEKAKKENEQKFEDEDDEEIIE